MPNLTVRRQDGADIILEDASLSIRVPATFFVRPPIIGQTYQLTLSPSSPDAPAPQEIARQILNELLTPSP